MGIKIENEIKNLFLDKEAIKLLGTVDENGSPHIVRKGSIHLEENGNIEYLELLETSRSYKNFTRSLWYDKKVSIFINGKAGQAYQIKGKPIKILIAGPVYEKNYVSLRKKLGDVDLAAVCIIETEEIIDEAFSVKFEKQESEFPIFTHLDRLLKDNI